ncbi:MAG: Na+/H+ antiporter NhaA [Sulfuricurvum sp.]
MNRYTLIHFFRHESATGILLVMATVLAMLFANTFLSGVYDDLKNIPAVVGIGGLVIAKPLLLWINDGLMAIFFFMVGLEIKREMTEGSLTDPKSVVLPAVAALGGMVVPALIYAAFNRHDPLAMEGWAIPTATDIAFALGVLSLLGDRVPKGLKLFLLTLAIIDDLGAIIVIALFYTSDLSLLSLAIASALILTLVLMNYKGVVNHTAYVLIGIVLWMAVLKSGVHATLAGVLLGLMIPIRNNKAPFHALEHSLHAPVNFFILPLFAFVNTGIDFSNISAKDVTHGLTLGVALGLFVGKQVGIALFTYLAVKIRWGRLPYGVSWPMLYGAAILSGIGFTMSLFIGSLAFEEARLSGELFTDERLGILLGSIVSGIIGYAVLLRVLRISSSLQSEKNCPKT